MYLPEAVCEHLEAWMEVREEEPGRLFNPVGMTGEVSFSRLRGETVWYLI